MTDSIDSLIARVLSIPEDRITDELGYQAIPQWDSLGHVELMLALEGACQVEIDAETLVTLQTVAEIRKFARRCDAPPAPAATPARTNATALEEGNAPDPGISGSVPSRDEEPPVKGALSHRESIHRGLNGVVLDETKISLIDGQHGRLFYRGCSIHDLAEHSTYEETAYLLLHGDLPVRAELERFDAQLKAARTIPAPVVEVIRQVREAHPMDVLRTAASALSAFDPDRGDHSAEAVRRKGLRLIAQLPTVVATHHALRSGSEPIAPGRALPHAANFLSLLTGAVPTPRAARLIDRNFVLHAEHGSNASAFAARVVTGTRADLHAAITAAIAAFSGPLHGGAAEDVMKMVREIEEPARAAEYVRERRARKEPIMGFGHRVYRTEDPRARHLRAAARDLSVELGEPRWFAILEAVAEAMRPYSHLGLNVNVDFYAGAGYLLLGLPEDLFGPVFVLSRLAGWVAQVLEQAENNILIRPLLRYEGEVGRPYLPIDCRPA
jgi:citrate synthase